MASSVTGVAQFTLLPGPELRCPSQCPSSPVARDMSSSQEGRGLNQSHTEYGSITSLIKNEVRELARLELTEVILERCLILFI